jgi:hypothetical protein
VTRVTRETMPVLFHVDSITRDLFAPHSERTPPTTVQLRRSRPPFRALITWWFRGWFPVRSAPSELGWRLRRAQPAKQQYCRCQHQYERLDPVNSGLNRRFLPPPAMPVRPLERRLENKICLRGDFARPLLNDGMSG